MYGERVIETSIALLLAHSHPDLPSYYNSYDEYLSDVCVCVSFSHYSHRWITSMLVDERIQMYPPMVPTILSTWMESKWCVCVCVCSPMYCIGVYDMLCDVVYF